MFKKIREREIGKKQEILPLCYIAIGTTSKPLDEKLIANYFKEWTKLSPMLITPAFKSEQECIKHMLVKEKNALSSATDKFSGLLNDDSAKDYLAIRKRRDHVEMSEFFKQVIRDDFCKNAFIIMTFIGKAEDIQALMKQDPDKAMSQLHCIEDNTGATVMYKDNVESKPSNYKIKS